MKLRTRIEKMLRLAMCATATATVCALPAEATIRYEVSVERPEQHLFRVSMEIPGVREEVRVQMAAWNALYQIRDFSSHVQQVEAFADGKKVEVEKQDKLTWRVKGNGTITVKYAVFWDDPGPFNTQLNAEHAFVNPAMVLLYVPERRAEQAKLALRGVPEQWKVAAASQVRNAGADAAKEFAFAAQSYDELIDAPIEAAKFEEFTIRDLTPPVRVVIHGDGWKRHDVENALRKLCAYEVKLMDGAPYQEYTFLFHVGKAGAGGGGGMEHQNSTAISVPAAAFLPTVASHEFFHLWNVKRIRPASLEPVDMTREMYTRALWFAEGVTNTYGSFAMVRTGLWSRREFYQDLSGQISELEARPAEQWQSAEQSSLDAWLEKYAVYNRPERSVSYYTKGQVLGLLLDIVLRDRTDNQKSLDDVMRAMNADFAREGKFYRDSLDVRLEAEKVAGGSLEDFFARYVGGAEALPYGDVLSKAGLELRSKEATHAHLGFEVEREPGGTWVVGDVESGSTSEAAGLRSGDTILRWNNGEVPRLPERWVAGQKPGDMLRLRVRRGEGEETLEMRIGEMREKWYEVDEAKDVSARARRIREGLLKGITDPVTAQKR